MTEQEKKDVLTVFSSNWCGALTICEKCKYEPNYLCENEEQYCRILAEKLAREIVPYG